MMLLSLVPRNCSLAAYHWLAALLEILINGLAFLSRILFLFFSCGSLMYSVGCL